MERLLVVAQCIDDVSEVIHPRSPTCPRPSWREIRNYRLEHGSYASTHNGMVIPKGPLFHQPFNSSAGDSFQECFSFLTVVPSSLGESPYKIDIHVTTLPAVKAPLNMAASCRVGFVPLAESHDDLCFKFKSRNGQDFVEVTIPHEANLAERAENALDLLADQGAEIIAFPECCVSSQVLTAIQGKLQELSKSGSCSIELVVAGSGLVHDGPGRPFNECTVLNYRGESLWQQRKLHHYTMDNNRAETFGFLSPDFENGYREDTQTGDCLLVRDVPGFGRVMVLICEDIHQDVPAVEATRRLEPDWIFCPILSDPITDTSWVRWDLVNHVVRRGARGVVANSMTLSARAGGTGDCGIGLITDRRYPGEIQLAKAMHGADSPVVSLLSWWT